MRLRIVVVDDEMLARSVIREYLAGDADAEIVAECANGFEAVKAVADLRPDVLLLDVQMPKLDGFEVFELVGRDVPVIFITAYDQYALKAFEVHAIDYLLKPFSRERLLDALQQVRERAAAGKLPSRALSAAARPPDEHASRIVARDGSKVHVIPIESIDYVQAQDDYVSIHADGASHLKEQTLGDLEAELNPKQFVRIHRSFIVNLNRLARVELDARENRVAVLNDGTKLPVSRSGYIRLGERLG